MEVNCHEMSFIALALKSLNKPKTLLKLAKQERLRKMLKRSRAMWPKYILLHTKNNIQESLYKRARELVCVLVCLCVWYGWWANEGAHPYL